MDIVVKTVLDFVQSIEGCENSVIAGGSVRDYLLKSKVPSRDYDIFVPDLGEQNNEMFKLIHEKFVQKAEGNFTGHFIDPKVGKPLVMNPPPGVVRVMNPAWEDVPVQLGNPGDVYTYVKRKKLVSSGYPESHFQVSKFKFEDKDFDFIVRKDVPNDETFAEKLIDTFNFGINMCYYDGISITTNEKFDNDQYNHCCTLWNTEVDGQSLLKTLEKYDALSKKFGLRFENKCLTKKEIMNGN